MSKKKKVKKKNLNKSKIQNINKQKTQYKKKKVKKRKLKKSVKRILFIIVSIIILIIAIFNFLNKKGPVQRKESHIQKNTYQDQLNKTCKEINYCKKKYYQRYEKYHNENNNLSIEDIITKVNIGLDHSFYTNTKKTPYLNKTYILVNKFYHLSKDYVPDDLEAIDEDYARSGMKLVKVAKEAFEDMAKHAKDDDSPIIAMSSYRSYKYQIDLYNKYAANDGIDAADTYSARPGYSEHQTGLCIDMYDGEIDYTNFEKSDSFKWMQENSYKYGFILRFPKNKENITGYQYESWHYRYVGKDIAKYIHDNDITFEEYYAKFIEDKM